MATITAYEWTVDGDIVSASSVFSYTFTSAGTYVVALTVTDSDGAVATRVYPIVVFQDGINYSWIFGDGGTSAVANPVYVYHIDGLYSVSLTMAIESNLDTETKTDYITVLPVDAIFYPTILTSFSGELVYNQTALTIPRAYRKYIESVDLLHKRKHSLKQTGFETVKYKTNMVSGTDGLGTISIMFVGDLPRLVCQQLQNLAIAINSVGTQLIFNDDFYSFMQYTCRWTNAGDFVGNDEILYGASMQLEVINFVEL